jgi:predicted nucleic acid-binding protein
MVPLSNAWQNALISPDNTKLYANYVARQRSAYMSAAGKPISQFDAMIVAMARSRGASLATRNIKDFDDCGTDVVNPWTA